MFIKDQVCQRRNIPRVSPKLSPVLDPGNMRSRNQKTKIGTQKSSGAPLPSSQNIGSLQLNNMSHNPEIVSTNKFNLMFAFGAPVGILMTLLYYYKDFASNSDFFGFSKEFQLIQFELIPLYFSNYFIPIALYCQNKRLRKFVVSYLENLF